jgi:hypothetical protein
MNSTQNINPETLNPEAPQDFFTGFYAPAGSTIASLSSRQNIPQSLPPQSTETESLRNARQKLETLYLKTLQRDNNNIPDSNTNINSNAEAVNNSNSDNSNNNIINNFEIKPQIEPEIKDNIKDNDDIEDNTGDNIEMEIEEEDDINLYKTDKFEFTTEPKLPEPTLDFKPTPSLTELLPAKPIEIDTVLPTGNLPILEKHILLKPEPEPPKSLEEITQTLEEQNKIHAENRQKQEQKPTTIFNVKEIEEESTAPKNNIAPFVRALQKITEGTKKKVKDSFLYQVAKYAADMTDNPANTEATLHEKREKAQAK